jgi:hypothetical protein
VRVEEKNEKEGGKNEASTSVPKNLAIGVLQRKRDWVGERRLF